MSGSCCTGQDHNHDDVQSNGAPSCGILLLIQQVYEFSCSLLEGNKKKEIMNCLFHHLFASTNTNSSATEPDGLFFDNKTNRLIQSSVSPWVPAAGDDNLGTLLL